MSARESLPSRIVRLFGWQSGATIDLTAEDLAEAAYAIEEMEHFGYRLFAAGRQIGAEHPTQPPHFFCPPAVKPLYCAWIDANTRPWNHENHLDRAAMGIITMFYPALAVLRSRGAVLEAPQ